MHEFLRIKRSIAPLGSEAVFEVGGFPVTNTTLMLLLVIGIVAAAGFAFVSTAQRIPGGFQNLIELFYEAVFNVVRQITGSNRRAEGIFPLVFALIVFIGLSNVLGLVPVLSSITFDGVSVFRTATSDFNTTFALAFAMVLFLQIVTIREWGLLAYIGRFFQFHGVIKGFRQGIGAGMTAVINFCIGLLDIVSEIAKIISLSLRLFGNMFAGEVLATVILGGIAFIVPALWMSMSLLSAVVQTMVFAFLVTAYYTLALKPEESAPDTKEQHVINQ